MPDNNSQDFERKLMKKQRIIAAASGRMPADLVLKNATFVNVFSNRLQKADIAVCDGIIAGFGDYEGVREVDMTGKIVCPGLLDGHIHLESSLVAPVEFVKAVIPHGTTTVITDPHEIANVMGTDGIDYMLQATKGLPVDVRFMLPSCVPSTPLDESGAVLSYQDITEYYENPRVLGLAEMMDFYGVIHGDDQCILKILDAQAHHRKIDGHGPGLSNKDLNAYISAGVYTDHECSTLEEAIEKLERGQMIMIREGTAAHNLDALIPLLKTQEYGDRCILCCDDKHPSDLLHNGHIDHIIKRAVKEGADPIIALKAGSLNTAKHFRLNDRGAIAPGYLADFMVVDNLADFNVSQVYKEGELVYNEGRLSQVDIPFIEADLNEKAHDTFRNGAFRPEDFQEDRQRAVIGTVDGEIITTNQGFSDHIDLEKDILKVAVIERHHGTGHIGIGYLKGYGLRSGAVATSFAHDSHNIIAVGTSEQDIAAAVNRLTENHGGIVVEGGGRIEAEVMLNIAGLMADEPLPVVNEKLEKAKEKALAAGVNPGIDPFMTLSFLSLPVIPELRLTTRGVFDVSQQKYI